MSYQYSSILINDRTISTTSIVEGTDRPQSDFEASTFDFIRQWLTGADEFEVTTSGSTGAPKTIRFKRQQMIASARATQKALGLAPGMTALLCIDTRYIGGKMMLVRSLEIGMEIVAYEPSALPLTKVPSTLCVNFAAFVPYQIYSMLNTGSERLLERAERGIIGGAPLSDNAIDRIKNLHSDYYLTYGMTETISHVALRKLTGQTASLHYSFLPGASGYIDERECLTIRTDYLEQPVATNDIVIFDDKNSFQFVGRLDNIINSAGVKIQPEKVEDKLQILFRDFGADERFFVTGIADKTLGTAVAIVVESSDNRQQFLEKKIPEIIQHLSSFERPRYLLISPAFSSTATGKINRVQSLSNASNPIRLERNHPL